MCNASMKIKRNLPDAPAPTLPKKVVTRQEKAEAAHWIRVREEKEKHPNRCVRTESPLRQKMYSERKNAANKRHAVVLQMAQEGKSDQEIAEATGYAMKSVEDIIYKLRKQGKSIPKRSRWKEVNNSG